MNTIKASTRIWIIPFNGNSTLNYRDEGTVDVTWQNVSELSVQSRRHCVKMLKVCTYTNSGRETETETSQMGHYTKPDVTASGS